MPDLHMYATSNVDSGPALSVRKEHVSSANTSFRQPEKHRLSSLPHVPFTTCTATLVLLENLPGNWFSSVSRNVSIEQHQSGTMESPLPVPNPRQFPISGALPGPRCGHTLTAIAGPDGDLSKARLILFGTLSPFSTANESVLNPRHCHLTPSGSTS